MIIVNWRVLKLVLFGLLIILFVISIYLFVGTPPQAEEISWGVNFSQKHAQYLGFSWKEVYSALLVDLGAKDVKIATHWDLLEPERDEYYFDDLDWQVQVAKEHQAKLLLAIGMKTPRWPECHIPNWAENLDEDDLKKEVLELVGVVVSRYKGSGVIKYWQVENEPFFPFGDCPKIDKGFFQQEVDLVKSLDSMHRIIISDTGEGSFWFNAARFGDVVGTTLYRKVWSRQLRSYVSYPLPPVFYWRKAQVIKKWYGKEVVCVELQAEPWGPRLLYDLSVEEQDRTMNLQRFREVVDFAQKTGLSEFYFWGAEWWYWLRTERGDSQIWDEARGLLTP